MPTTHVALACLYIAQAMSKENRGKTLDDLAAAADEAMTFTAVLNKPPGGTYGVVRFLSMPWILSS